MFMFNFEILFYVGNIKKIDCRFFFCQGRSGMIDIGFEGIIEETSQ